MQIIPMTAEHIEAVAALEQACFSAPWSEAALAEELTNPLAVFRVAVDATGQVLGYMGFHHIGDEGYVTNVAVMPSARRQGAAAALLAETARYATRHRLYRVTLEVRVSNAPAIALYEGAGYVRDGVRPRFYRDPTEDAAIYSRYFVNGQ